MPESVKAESKMGKDVRNGKEEDKNELVISVNIKILRCFGV